MPNQRAIAAAVGVSQATVSMALRGDLTIPLETRQRIQEAADRLGYRPNPVIASLMEHIREGREVREQGCIAVLLDAASEGEAFFQDTYLYQYKGMQREAAARGYATECFYLRAPGVSAARVDRQLWARGITGLILAAPCQGTDLAARMHWEHYACATVAYTWKLPGLERVTSHHRHNVDCAVAELGARGYRRVGMCLPAPALAGVDSAWYAGYLVWQSHLPRHERVPLFVGSPGTVPFKKFRAWYEKWRPDALIGLRGEELAWMQVLGLTYHDLGLICLNVPANSPFSGIDENHTLIGEKTCAVVVNQLVHNQRGLSARPPLILIEGTWRDGATAPGRGEALSGS